MLKQFQTITMSRSLVVALKSQMRAWRPGHGKLICMSSSKEKRFWTQDDCACSVALPKGSWVHKITLSGARD